MDEPVSKERKKLGTKLCEPQRCMSTVKLRIALHWLVVPSSFHVTSHSVTKQPKMRCF